MKKRIRYQSLALLVGELLLLCTSVAWNEIQGDPSWPVWFYLFILGAGGYSLASSRRWLISFVALSIVGVAFGAFGEKAVLAQVISTASFAFVLALLFRAVLRHCFFNPEVSKTDRIIGGIAGYLLLGIFWSSQSEWAIMMNPDAFVHSGTGEVANRSEVLYFSFITMTTVGFGDFAAVTPLARLITLLNGLTGVLYIAIFIAALMERGTDSK